MAQGRAIPTGPAHSFASKNTAAVTRKNLTVVEKNFKPVCVSTKKK